MIVLVFQAVHADVCVLYGFNIMMLILYCLLTLGGDKVGMLIHTYTHKLLSKIKVTICNHQADSPLYVWPDV